MLEEVMVEILGQLKRIADAQETFVRLGEWNKARLGGTDCPQDAPAAPPPEPEAAPETAQNFPIPLSYEELKAKLIARGVEVKKGTKMNTLLKLWSSLPAEEPVNEAAVTEPDEEVEEAPNLADTESHPQVDEAPAAKPMTALEARDAIMELGYTGTPEQRDAMKQALAAVGKAKFTELAEGEYEQVISVYKVSMYKRARGLE